LKPDPLLDFRNFLYLVWKHLRLKPPTRRQNSIAHWLQHGPRRRGVKAFRGVGKSWITAALVVWFLYRNPQENILVLSASKTRADNFTTFCLQLIHEIPQLQHLRPRPEQRCSKLEFDVSPAEADQNASVRSAGITGQITGFRATLIIADDIEVPNNSATQAMREKLSELVKEFDAILTPNGQVIYLGTPQTEDSIYSQLTERGYTFRVWPAEYPDEQQLGAYGTELAPDIREDLANNPSLVGRSTEPTRFTDDDLSERRLSYGRGGYALQFMLDTRVSDENRYPLRLADLIVTPCDVAQAPEKLIWSGTPEYIINDLPVVGMGRDRLYRPVPLTPSPEYRPYQGIVLAVDPGGRGRDETGYAVVAFLHSHVFLLDAGGLDGYGPESLQALANIARKYRVHRVIAEANFGDGMFSQLMRPVLSATYPCTVEEVKHSVQKEKRIIDTLEPVMSSHRLVVDRQLILKDHTQNTAKDIDSSSDKNARFRYQLFYQMTRLTRDRGSLMQDDRLDAVSIGVAHFTALMSADVDKAVAMSRERAMDEEIREFLKHAIDQDEPQHWNPRP
jgi:hypothetical protein